MRLKIAGNYLQGATDCEFTLRAVTADVSTKNDPGGGMWDHPEFSHYEFSMSKQAFFCNWTQLQYLLNDTIQKDTSRNVYFDYKTEEDVQLGYGSFLGAAFVTQLKIEAANGEKAKISISMEGSGTLSYLHTKPSFDTAELSAYEGRTLMLFAKKNASSAYYPFAFATSHSLTVNVQLSDSSNKDFPNEKEVTGKSIVLTTDNVVSLRRPPALTTEKTLDWEDLTTMIMEGQKIEMAFGYVASAEDLGTKQTNWEISAGIIEGKFLATNLSTKASVKGYATYSAEFTSVSQVTFTMSVNPPDRTSTAAANARTMSAVSSVDSLSDEQNNQADSTVDNEDTVE